MQPLLLLLLIGSYVSTSYANPGCKVYLDTFEDLDTNSLAPQFTNVATYHGITYKAFTVSTRSPILGTVGGLEPASGDNIAGFTMVEDLIQLESLTLTPFGYLEASAEIKTFDLNSLYFGCTFDTHSTAVQTNQACTIYIIGYFANGAQGPVQAYSFYPRNGLDSPMQLVTLPNSYRQLSRVVLSIASAALSVSQGILFVDDVKHCNYS